VHFEAVGLKEAVQYIHATSSLYLTVKAKHLDRHDETSRIMRNTHRENVVRKEGMGLRLTVVAIKNKSYI
jgi:hypothetical protein